MVPKSTKNHQTIVSEPLLFSTLTFPYISQHFLNNFYIFYFFDLLKTCFRTRNLRCLLHVQTLMWHVVSAFCQSSFPLFFIDFWCLFSPKRLKSWIQEPNHLKQCFWTNFYRNFDDLGDPLGPLGGFIFLKKGWGTLSKRTFVENLGSLGAFGVNCHPFDPLSAPFWISF